MSHKSKRRTKSKPRKMEGRPPTGLRPGVRLSDYPRLQVRVPIETVARLRALAEKQGVPQWRILHDAIKAYSIR